MKSITQFSIWTLHILWTTGFSPEKQPRAPLAPSTSSPNCPEEGSEGDQGATGGSDPPAQVAIIPGSDDQQLSRTYFDLSSDFAAFYFKVVPLLARAVTAVNLKRYLTAFRHPESNLPYVDPSLYQYSTSVEEILDKLESERYIHPIQTNLLGKIVRTHGCNESNCLLQEYESKIPKSTPLKRSHNDLTDEETESSSSTKKLKVEVSGDSDKYCLEDVEEVQKALEKTTRVDHGVIVYAKHEPGSVILTFIIPESTVEYFTAISKSEKQLSDLAAIGILSIKIGQVTIDVKAHLLQGRFGQRQFKFTTLYSASYCHAHDTYLWELQHIYFVLAMCNYTPSNKDNKSTQCNVVM